VISHIILFILTINFYTILSDSFCRTR